MSAQRRKRINSWPDFIFTIVVRLFFGIVLGGLACFVFMWRGILNAFAHNNTRVPLVVISVCGILGGLIAVFTVPRWQTPWYKGLVVHDAETRNRERLDNEI